jgi:hypothetical protein
MAEHTLLTTTPATDPRENDPTLAAQIRDVRNALLRDGEAAGVDPAAIDAAVDRALAVYADRPVRAFAGVLVERSVREQLALRRTSL